MEIKDKIVVVTGAARGIGKAMCQRFHQEGAAGIVVADLDLAEAEAVAAELGGIARRCDVSQEADIQALVAAAEAEYGRIDLFCSNAGLGRGDGEHCAAASNDTWQLMWEVHVMSHVWAARACLPKMLERGSGYFLNTSSAAGLLNQVGDAAYSTTKHAAVGFAESLSISHGAQGIGVSLLCPQYVATRMIGDESDGANGVWEGVITPAQLADVVVAGLAAEDFLILPHPEVLDFYRRKGENYGRWIGGMRKIYKAMVKPDGDVDFDQTGVTQGKS